MRKENGNLTAENAKNAEIKIRLRAADVFIFALSAFSAVKSPRFRFPLFPPNPAAALPRTQTPDPRPQINPTADEIVARETDGVDQW
jgi:hypothetical protein